MNDRPETSQDAAFGDAAAQPGAGVGALAFGSLGVVYGDIGTSPIYAIREAVGVAAGHGVAVPEAVMGVLSMILWSLILIVTGKYVLILLRLDNRGEGGPFALMALARSAFRRGGVTVVILGVAGASLFYGDAILTPAISVLSAIEGLQLTQPQLGPFVPAISIGVLVALFALQARGTDRVARYFAPAVAVWFLVLAATGLVQIAGNPSVLLAVNPAHAFVFVVHNPSVALAVLGLVFLVVTGAEALYADLGHFGRPAIQTAWLAVVFPALVMNYLGQGALLLSHPAALDHPFFRMFPDWALVPAIALTTLATVIASQAVISGAFSLTQQAIQLRLLPRFNIRHTSALVPGQIYLGRINLILLLSTVLVVAIFPSSSALASAYGLSISGIMVVTSLLAILVVWKLWGWRLWLALALLLPFLALELAFLTANSLKLFDGGWFPLVIAGAVYAAMLTWKQGTEILRQSTRNKATELDWLLDHLPRDGMRQVPGTAVFLTPDPDRAPASLMHNMKHNHVLHERNVILSLETEDSPRVDDNDKIVIEQLPGPFVLIIAKFGFMEQPSIPKIFRLCAARGLGVDIAGASFFVSRRTLQLKKRPAMPYWRSKLFLLLSRSAEDATAHFAIPPDRVVELGTRVAI